METLDRIMEVKDYLIVGIFRLVQEVEQLFVITEKLLEAKHKVNQAWKGHVLRRRESPNTKEIQHQPRVSTQDNVQIVQSPG